MKTALIQMKVTGSKADNVKKACGLVSSAAEKGADIIALPEMFCCPYNNASFAQNAEERGGAVFSALADAARKNRVWLVGGSMPEREGERIYNTSFIFSPQGECVARHRKAHLFDIDVKGGQRFRESDTFTAGEGPTVFDTPWGKLGVCICFDIRFPLFIRKYADLGARALIVPAAFNMTTGPLHWQLLFRARAVDNQLFTFGCAPARDESQSYISYANSIAVDPWGKVLGCAGEDERVCIFDIDLDECERVREQIPIGL